MAKKIFVSFAIVILSLCCSVCFAADNSNVNLGNEMTQSLDKAGDSVRNVADDVMDAGSNAMRSVGNTLTGNDTANNNRNYGANDNGYNAVRTSVDEATATTNMSTTTWIWIILAVAAIVIVAMVWYYAVQNNDRD